MYVIIVECAFKSSVLKKNYCATSLFLDNVMNTTRENLE